MLREKIFSTFQEHLLVAMVFWPHRYAVVLLVLLEGDYFPVWRAFKIRQLRKDSNIRCHPQ